MCGHSKRFGPSGILQFTRFGKEGPNSALAMTFAAESTKIFCHVDTSISETEAFTAFWLNAESLLHAQACSDAAREELLDGRIEERKMLKIEEDAKEVQRLETDFRSAVKP